MRLCWVSNMNFYITKHKGRKDNGLQDGLRILVIDAKREETMREGRYSHLQHEGQ